MESLGHVSILFSKVRIRARSTRASSSASGQLKDDVQTDVNNAYYSGAEGACKTQLAC